MNERLTAWAPIGLAAATAAGVGESVAPGLLSPFRGEEAAYADG